eukprot:gene1948-2986_t
MAPEFDGIWLVAVSCLLFGVVLMVSYFLLRFSFVELYDHRAIYASKDGAPPSLLHLLGKETALHMESLCGETAAFFLVMERWAAALGLGILFVNSNLGEAVDPGRPRIQSWTIHNIQQKSNYLALHACCALAISVGIWFMAGDLVRRWGGTMGRLRHRVLQKKPLDAWMLTTRVSGLPGFTLAPEVHAKAMAVYPVHTSTDLDKRMRRLTYLASELKQMQDNDEQGGGVWASLQRPIPSALAAHSPALLGVYGVTKCLTLDPPTIKVGCGGLCPPEVDLYEHYRRQAKRLGQEVAYYRHQTEKLPHLGTYFVTFKSVDENLKFLEALERDGTELALEGKLAVPRDLVVWRNLSWVVRDHHNRRIMIGSVLLAVVAGWVSTPITLIASLDTFPMDHYSQ